jgi:hypothetical protein
VFWIALAVAQHDVGRLADDVRDTALAAIDSGGDLDRWQDSVPTVLAKRRAVLEKARAQLMSAQRARKRIRRPRKMIMTLTPGDVVGYRADSGRWHLMVVRALSENRYALAPYVRVLDYADTELPAEDDLAGLCDRPASKPYLGPDTGRHGRWSKGSSAAMVATTTTTEVSPSSGGCHPRARQNSAYWSSRSARVRRGAAGSGSWTGRTSSSVNNPTPTS